MTQTVRIIGIDPGLRFTGWGILEITGNHLHFIAAGTIFSNSECSVAVRLCQLYQGLSHILATYQPDEAAVEHVFVNKDAIATLKLGQARGIALLVPAQSGIDVTEYAPNTVKKSVIGVGHGTKQQIHIMVKTLLPQAKFDSNDAADALAIALCHAYNRQIINLEQRIKAPT